MTIDFAIVATSSGPALSIDEPIRTPAAGFVVTFSPASPDRRLVERLRRHLSRVVPTARHSLQTIQTSGRFRIDDASDEIRALLKKDRAR